MHRIVFFIVRRLFSRSGVNQTFAALSLLAMMTCAMTSLAQAPSPKASPEPEDTSEFAEELENFDISDSLAVDDLIENWQSQFDEWSTGLGLGEGMLAHIVLTVTILVAFITLRFIFQYVLMFFARKLEAPARHLHFRKKKLKSLARILLQLLSLIFAIGAITALALTWEIPIQSIIESPIFINALATVITIYLLIFFGVMIIELSNGLMEKGFRTWGRASESRMQTLLPIAKNSVTIVLGLIFLLMLLSELGINVMPLLAGAGVLGFAVGFGAQTIIKDLLTGFIIILEDLIQVGDVVRLADRLGRIEKITIRKVQIRDLSGTVFTVPFSEIAIVENLTKDFSYAMFDIGIAYREDVDEVMALLREIDETMREESDIREAMLEPIEILGLDKFADSAVVIKARIKTRPMQQWGVMREYNRRLKRVFDEREIEIPFPHQTIYFGEDRNGSAPPLRLKHASNGKKNNTKVKEKDTHPKSSSVPSDRNDGEDSGDNDEA